MLCALYEKFLTRADVELLSTEPSNPIPSRVSFVTANQPTINQAKDCLAFLLCPDEIPDVYIVERLFSSSLVVVVSHAKPQQMNVYHFKKGTEICNYSYSSNILSIRLNRQVRGWGIGLPRALPVWLSAGADCARSRGQLGPCCPALFAL